MLAHGRSSLLPDFMKLLQLNKGVSKFFIDWNIRASQELPNKTPNNAEKFDFIVIGAGSAGSVLASRLSENKSTKVLLLEEGGTENLLLDIPIFALLQYYFGDIYWDYFTEPSDDYCTSRERKQCRLPSGKIMGGSSIMNFMIATRGKKLSELRLLF